MKMNQNGASIAEVTVSAALVAMLALSSASLYSYYNQQDDQAKYKQTAVLIRQQVLSLLSNEDSWNQTVTLNVNGAPAFGIPANAASKLKCLIPSNNIYCQNQIDTEPSISVFDAQGTLFINGNSNTAGFTKYGQPCNTFDGVNGNDACPIKISVGWTASCAVPMDSWNLMCCNTPGPGPSTCAGGSKYSCVPGKSCKVTQSLLQATFTFKPNSALTQLTTNLAKYNLVDLPRVSADAEFGPDAYCASIGKFYYPTATGTHIGLSGQIDSNGCILLCKLQGTGACP